MPVEQGVKRIVSQVHRPDSTVEWCVERRVVGRDVLDIGLLTRPRRFTSLLPAPRPLSHANAARRYPLSSAGGCRRQMPCSRGTWRPQARMPSPSAASSRRASTGAFAPQAATQRADEPLPCSLPCAGLDNRSWRAVIAPTSPRLLQEARAHGRGRAGGAVGGRAQGPHEDGVCGVHPRVRLPADGHGRLQEAA